MRYALAIIFLTVVTQAFFVACTKPANIPTAITDTTMSPLPPDTSGISFPNEWQCEIDGVSYSGVVDTGFIRLAFPYYSIDTVIICTGTSFDKKAQLHFNVTLDRTKYPGTGVNNISNTYITFDTSADNIFTANINNHTGTVNYLLDSIAGNNIKMSFSGMITDQHFINHTINGSFSCKLYTGSSEPNKFYCALGSDHYKRDGFFSSAIFSANTLNLIGIDYRDYPLDQFKLSVRTGGTIKPGTYYSENGDVFFHTVPPSFIGDKYYVDDSMGKMSVTITSVSGNVVTGFFSGTSPLGNTIDSGMFICRVPNYQPQQDADTRWSFGAWVNPSFGDYSCYAGNTTGALLSEAHGTHYLTINGESDHGTSVFKLVVSSLFDTIHTGYYYFINTYDEFLDSFYFRSAIPTWDRKLTNFYIDRSVLGFGETLTCIIDTLDDKHVTGILFGEPYGNMQRSEIHRARFSAKF